MDRSEKYAIAIQICIHNFVTYHLQTRIRAEDLIERIPELFDISQLAVADFGIDVYCSF